jgi:hypothetical protein
MRVGVEGVRAAEAGNHADIDQDEAGVGHRVAWDTSSVGPHVKQACDVGVWTLAPGPNVRTLAFLLPFSFIGVHIRLAWKLMVEEWKIAMKA